MNEIDQNDKAISREEAKVLLNEVADVKRSVVDAVCPPWWLNLLVSANYGMVIVSYASMRHENQWALGLIISLSLIFLIAGFSYYSYRLIGIKIRLTPQTKAGQWLYFGHGLISAIGIVAGRELHVSGYEWVTYLIALSLACLNGYLMHVFPTGDVIERKNYE